MVRIIEGNLKGDGKRFALVVSRFNEFISSKLTEGATDALLRHGVSESDIDIIKVPGAYEIPKVAKKMAQRELYDGIICIGAVIRGSTPHFEYIASEVAKGVALVALDVDVPVIFGVLTTDTIEQAIERAGTKAGNKGFDAAVTAIEMANLFGQIGSS